MHLNVPTFAVGDALLLVDPQNDFCPGGSLPVTDGDRVMPVLSAWAAAAHAAQAPVFVSRDWHPPDTTHFTMHGGVWPPHCVQGTPGAEFHADLEVPRSAVVVSKGMGSTEDAYSAFQARDANGTPLSDLLRARGVNHLYVMGLATDYCVEASALGGLDVGLRVSVVQPGCRAVDIRPGDGTLAFERMQAAGAQLIA
ncbi:MAG: bifunctional nicotinamidase/pyrazinamidase [Chloroflexota bacterium]